MLGNQVPLLLRACAHFLTMPESVEEPARTGGSQCMEQGRGAHQCKMLHSLGAPTKRLDREAVVAVLGLFCFVFLCNFFKIFTQGHAY